MAATKFSYSARSLNGEIQSGVLSADNEAAVAKRLQSMGLAPVSIRKAEGATAKKSIGPPKKVKSKHLAVFCRQFAVMLESGMPMVRTIAALTEQIDHPELQRILPMVRSDVETGQSFSQAMGKYPNVFPPLMVGMISSGEASGNLAETMHRIGDNYDKEAKLKAKVVSAMMYPVIVFVMAIVMIIGMLLFIVPTFATTFGNLGGDLPLPTKLLVTASEFMKVAAIPMIVAAVVGAVWWKKNKHSEKVRNIVDPLKLKIPIMGPFVKKIALARFARTFSSLLESGVPMLQSLDMTMISAGNQVIVKALQNVKEGVKNGRPLAAPLAQETIFPNMVTQMVATGEETGNVPVMLQKVADYYDMEVDTTADALTSILEPIMIVGLAVVVGGMVVAMYLPMFSIFDLIQ